MTMHQRHSGFSLIELLVVFMIIAMVMSVVAPSVNKMYRQHMAQQETRMLQQYIKTISSQAYARYQDASIHLSGNRLAVTADSPWLDNTKAAEVTGDVSYSDTTAQHSRESDQDENGQVEESGHTVFEAFFEYLVFSPSTLVAQKNGFIQQDAVLVTVAQTGLEKSIAIRGLAFVEYH